MVAQNGCIYRVPSGAVEGRVSALWGGGVHVENVVNPLNRGNFQIEMS